MNVSYENNEKQCFLKRMWNKIFHKEKLLPAPVQYTSKEVKLKMHEILSFFRYRDRLEKQRY